MSDGLGGEIQRWPPPLRPTGETDQLFVSALVTDFHVNREGLHNSTLTPLIAERKGNRHN